MIRFKVIKKHTLHLVIYQSLNCLMSRRRIFLL